MTTPVERATRRVTIVGTGSATLVESSGSRPAIDSQTERGVVDRSTEDADVVERRRERDETVAAHATVRRLHANDAAERRGLSNRTTGL